jgi:hypothetical protein
MGQRTKQFEDLSEATIRGERIKVGDRAEDVESRLQPDSMLDPNRGKNYGYAATARFIEGGAIYIVKYGPPQSGSGAYIVAAISRMKARY